MNRREFAALLGAAAVVRPAAWRPTAPTPAQPSTAPRELSEQAHSWLAHLHRKVSLGGTWHKDDIVGPQWDTTSFVPTMGYARYEPTWLAWSLGLMAATTPAWREEYARILAFLGDRYCEYWSMYEWVEHRGDDPQRGAYPAAFKGMIPEGWFGRYNLPGWAGNGTGGVAYDPDPIRAAGRYGLMYKGYMNLVLSMYAYVSDDGRFERPFTVKYDDANQWKWTQRQLNGLLAEQWAAHPEGIACEIAKVYPWCNTLSGVSVILYDGLRGTRFATAYREWQKYYATHYVGPSAGRPEWLTGYHDPLNHVSLEDRGSMNGGNWMATAWHGLAADPALFEPLARHAVNALYRPIAGGKGYFSARGAADADLNIVTGLGAALASELGDQEKAEAARAYIMERYEPRWDRTRGEFAFGFGLNEPWPRGQMNAWVMPAFLVQTAGQWRQLVQAPDPARFTQPTVEGVDFPAVRVTQAQYDAASRTLHVGLAAGDRQRAGQPTSFRVTRLAQGARVQVTRNGAGQEYRAIDGTITVPATIDAQRFVIRVG